jgi:translation initiation factor 4G
MFNILSGESEPATTERRTSTDAESQRPKLKLQPRTKPLPGQDGEGEGGEGEGEDEEGSEEEEQPATPAEPAGMSEDAAKTKIASDMKELWGEKDRGGSRNPEDIAEYFKALPEERQPLLAERLSEDVFRIAKIKDAEVVAKGYSAALEQRAAALDVLVKG